VGNFAANRAYSIGAGYANAGLKLGLAYMQANGVGSNDKGAITDFTYLNNDDNLIASDVRQRTFGAGVSYSIGAATFGALWTQTRLHRNSFDGSTTTNNYEINGRYALTPALSLGAAYTYSRYRDSFSPDASTVRAHQFAPADGLRVVQAH
jgi:predicted porin